MFLGCPVQIMVVTIRDVIRPVRVIDEPDQTLERIVACRRLLTEVPSQRFANMEGLSPPGPRGQTLERTVCLLVEIQVLAPRIPHLRALRARSICRSASRLAI